jgi:cytidine deaminase
MEINIKFELFEDWKSLISVDVVLIEKAIAISETAYAIYSSFHVGAALLLENGEVILGSNQENIAYPSGLCAERTALFYAGSQYPAIKVKKLVIYGAGDLLESGAPVPPCGACRQVIAQTIQRQGEGFELLLIGRNGQALKFENALDLLPLPFGFSN